MFRGAGTALNVVTVLVGSGLGVAIGGRLPARTRAAVTDALGLVTLVIAGLNVADGLGAEDLRAAVGAGAGLLVVLGALLLGGIAGSLLRLEGRLEAGGDRLRRWLVRPAGVPGRVAAGAQTGPDRDSPERRERFVQGFVTASLVFCVGPLTVLGSLSDGLGRGIDQLALKSTLDGFAALAFASSLGWGVAASALSVLVVQGGLTAVGAALGSLLPGALVSSVTATGGVLLLGVGLRLLQVRAVPVGDLLPALVAAPVLTLVVQVLR